MGRIRIFLGGALIALGTVSLLRTTASQGNDFLVFWNGAHSVLTGLPLYSIARDGGHVFKYPPWVIPFFFPFCLFSPENSRWIWGAIEVTSLFMIVRWLIVHFYVPKRIWFSLLIAFWGLWIIHAFDGQISLVLLALALYLYSDQPNFTAQFSPRLFFLILALSTKIFTLFPLFFGLRWSKQSIPTLIKTGVGVIFLSLPAIWSEIGHSPSLLFKNWVQAACSGGTLLDTVQLRGRLNPGLPGYALRLLHIPSYIASADVIASIFFCFLLGIIWWRISHRISGSLAPFIQWVGGLALTPVIHPLPWWHLFVFSFPLANLSLSMSLQAVRNSKLCIYLSIIGIFLICLSTEKVLGEFGVFLELNAAKSWGTLLCLAAVSICSNRPMDKEVIF